MANSEFTQSILDWSALFVRLSMHDFSRYAAAVDSLSRRSAHWSISTTVGRGR